MEGSETDEERKFNEHTSILWHKFMNLLIDDAVPKGQIWKKRQILRDLFSEA